MQTKLQFFLREVENQRKWIEQCGGDVAGYIAKYSGHYDRDDAQAAKIYEADVNWLRYLEERVEHYRRRTQRSHHRTPPKARTHS